MSASPFTEEELQFICQAGWACLISSPGAMPNPIARLTPEAHTALARKLELALGKGKPGAVHLKPDGWYFWDETGAHALGPFATSDEAAHMLKRYADSL